MATDTANSNSPPAAAGPRPAGDQPPSGSGAGGYGASVQRQLRKTQAQVKFVDLCTALMVLAAGSVGFLLVAAIIDHWILGLGVWARLMALMILLGGCGWHFYNSVLPLLTRRINPLYAARSIEQGTPDLKNSLINFLMFRANQSSVHRVVYQAMEHKAAVDLASVPVETAVDRSKMIKVGYVLAAVLTLGAAYAILSPKNPFQTAARIAVPWQAIARPSRVVIDEVKPGTVEVVQGQFVDVVARIRGARPEKDAVTLVYSTRDGQTVERRVAMQLDDHGVAYHGQLPAGTAGLQHDLDYRVESGDAISERFTVTLSPAPTIAVDSLDYEFPGYTGRPRETVHREGNIRGLEGTRVTIVATANKPIRSAAITFNPHQPTDAARPPVRLAMDFQDRTARQTFTLALTSDRRTPVYDTYQLSFVTAAGDVSQHPILHQIDVVPDLAPEVSILDPIQNRITVPVSGRRKIEVRAVDPDFGLRRLKLRAVAGGTDVLDEVMFEEPRGRRGQTIVTYEFAPARLGLAANDRVTYWAVAEDNRVPFPGDHVDGNQSGPNVARTRNYLIEIVPDPPAPTSPGATPNDSDAGPSKSGSDQQQPQRDPTNPDSAKPPAEDSEKRDSPPDSPAPDPSSPPEDDPQEKGPEDSEASKSEDGSGGSQSSSQSGSPDAESQQGQGGAGAPQDGQSQPGDTGSSGGSGGSTPQSSGQPDGASAGQGGDAPPKELHDGEVFEKVLQRMKDEQAEGQGRSDPNGNDASDNSGDTPPGQHAEQPGSGTPSEKPSGNANDRSKPQGDAAGNSQGSDTKSQLFSEDSQSPAKSSPPADGTPQPGDGAQQPDAKRGAGDQKAGNPGEGGDTNPTSGEQQGKQKPDVPGEPDQRPKEPGSGDNGESGAGQNSQDTEGTGSVESSQDQTVTNRDKPKSGNPDSTEPQEKSDPGSTNSKKQSDSEGGESGDQSGGGKKGPGQGANQAGNDSAGQNSSADDGAGASSESGDGETSNTAGNKQEAPGKTGSAGNQQGQGSSARKDPNGNQENDGTNGSAPEAAGSDENRKPRDTQKGGGGGNRPGDAGLPTGGGVPSDVRHNSGMDPTMEVADGDAANLTYSQQATDLVIDYLKDQESRPNPELLKELGWTPEEMKQFVDRWQRLKQAAVEDGGRHELNESLRSLGLRSPETKLRQRRVRSDDTRGMSESGEVSEPPAAYRDLFDAFRKGTARVRGN